MKKILFIFPCILIIMKINAQHYSEDRKRFTFKDIAYETEISETDDQYGYKASLNVYNIKYGENNLIKKIKIPDTKYDADLITFGEYVNEKKKFVLLQHRYSFYILNLYNDKLLGPYYPKFYGIGEDAQSGMVAGLKIIYDGRFITGYCVDSGCFLFDLTDIYGTKELIPETNPLYSENRIYVLKQFKSKGKKFALHLKNDGWVIRQTLLFTDKFIETNKTHTIPIYENPEEIPEPEYPYAEYNFTLLKEILNDTAYQYLVYDNYTGEKVDLSNSLARSNKKKIKAHLNKR